MACTSNTASGNSKSHYGNVYEGNIVSDHGRANYGNLFHTNAAGGHARVHYGDHYGDIHGTITHTYSSYLDAKRKRREDYTIAWICALADPEWQASRLMFDNTHDDASMPMTKHQYRYGEINGHYVVMGCVQEAQIGTNVSAAVAAEMISLFPSLKFAVLVGLGSGVWSEHHDVRLGDVVVGLPDLDRDCGGLIQLDLGRSPGKKEVQSGSLRAPPVAVVSAIDDIRSSPTDGLNLNMQSFVQYAADLPQYSTRPKSDELFKSTHTYSVAPSPENLIFRKTRLDTSSPQVHYGTIASLDRAVSDAKLRDEVAERWDVLCFEFEAAGLMENLPCVVVRGIGDYGDTHKTGEWRPYAAAVAAAWAKDLLYFLSPDALDEVHSITSETTSMSYRNPAGSQVVGIDEVVIQNSNMSDEALPMEPPDRPMYRCIFSSVNGQSPTKHCDRSRQYVSQLRVHHFNSEHPGGPFGCCKNCFAIGAHHRNEFTGQEEYERFKSSKELATHELACTRSICIDERCVNFDQETPVDRPCKHESKPSQRQIWRMWYRRAHGLDRDAHIPEFREWRQQSRSYHDEPEKSLDPVVITPEANTIATGFSQNTYSFGTGHDFWANSFIDSGLGSSIAPTKRPTNQDMPYSIAEIEKPRNIAESTVDLPYQVKASLSLQFASQLAKETKRFLKDLVDLNDLQTLLRSYAMATRTTAGTDHIHRQAAKYVDRNGNDIVKEFEELMMAHIQLHSSHHVTSEDRMEDYLRPGTVEADVEQQPLDLNQALIDTNRPGHDDDEALREKLEQARDFLFNSAEFEWLVQKVKILTSWSPKPTTYTNVRRTLVNHLASSKKSESLGLSVQWNIREFLEQQYADKDRDIGSIIVYCGHSDALYATHASAYLSTVWPSIGQETIDCLRAAYTNQHSTANREISGCSMNVSLGRDFVDLSLSGNTASVLDIAEAVIWLATSCRASDSDQRAAYCFPRLYQRPLQLEGLLVTPAFKPIENTQSSAEFQCWMNMVHNPVIAIGYPIPRRDNPAHQKGLEVSLSLLVGLSCANYATSFGNTFLIKGLFSAIVPVLETAAAVVWHFHKTTDALMTYDQACSFGLHNPVTTLSHLDIPGLENKRHFVGFWTGRADFFAGTNDSEIYRFHQSQSLPIDHTTVTLTGFNVSGGKYITAGLAFAIGKKDRGIADVAGKMPFELQIDQAMDKTVLFYGDEDQRGWLVDGATALLHLTIAWVSLKRRKERPDTFEKLRYMTQTGGPRAAKEALLANANLQLYTTTERKIEQVRTKGDWSAGSSDLWDSAYATGSSSGNSSHALKQESKKTWTEWTFEDIAVRLLQLLEAMSASVGKQQNTKREIPVKAPNFRPVIAGWEAWDIIQHKTNPKGEFELRALHLKPQAKGWLDFVQKRGSVVFLAKTFGDLIKPRDIHLQCVRSFPLPRDQGFLAVPLHLLEPEPESRYSRLDNLDHSKSCMQIGDYLYWHSFEINPKQCQCSSGLRCKVISKMGSKALDAKGKASALTPINLFQAYPDGAAIIGDSRSAAILDTENDLQGVPSLHSIDVNSLYHSMSDDNDGSSPANEDAAQAVAGAENGQRDEAVGHQSAAAMNSKLQDDSNQDSTRSKIPAGKRAFLRGLLLRRKRSQQ